MLVLSKVYLVTKGSLVPLVVGASERPGGDELASANARLGLLSSLASLVASIPAIGVLRAPGWRLGPAPGHGRVRRRHRRGPAAAGGAAHARRIGGGCPHRGRADGAGPSRGHLGRGDATTGPWGRVCNTHPEVLLALSAMSVLRGLVGFVTFLLAFSLDRMKSATGWYGLMLGASVAGALVGVMIVPRARKVLTEPQMLTLSIWSVALAGGLTAVVGGIVIQAFLAFVVGLASAASKPAFDALVQRYVPTAAQGRAFARFETRLQLVWVLGALLPVVVSLPLGSGDVVIAAVAAVTGLSYITSRSSVAPPLGHALSVSPAGAPARRVAR